ncbi:hypothetical protein APHAL10511_001705 [Amanita phalloides]|nr:hypothetical protein APHAL10511_001705 [Amanita phalloides]
MANCFMRPQGGLGTRISMSRDDKHKPITLDLGRKFHSGRKAGISSHLLTLSPIMASPSWPTTPAFSVIPGSPASAEYVTAPNSPSVLPSATLSSGSQSMSKVPYIPPSLSTSTSYPAPLLLRAQPELVVSRETRHCVRPLNTRHRSLSDSSLPLRQNMGIHNYKNLDTPSLPEPFQTRAEDINVLLRHRAKFHIPRDRNSDEEDDQECTQNALANNEIDTNVNDNEDLRDVTRRFHALKELLATESGYLNDLKTLVKVYLHDLSQMTCRPRTLSRMPSFFAAGTWIGSHSSHSSVQLHDSRSSTLLGQDRLSMIQRHFFSESEINLLRRNIEHLLLLHGDFVQELEETVRLLGITADLQQDAEVPSATNLAHLDLAIQAVAQLFVRQASRFHIYQDFCAGHPAALKIIRLKQHQHPVEWDAFEQRCALTIIRSGPISESHAATESQTERCKIPDTSRKRTASLTALDEAIRSFRVFAPKENGSLQCDVRHDKIAQRLMFMDYLIKPVQRICRYPLLLDQLRPVRFPMDVGDIVRESILAMKDIAAAVDEARHQRDIATKSLLIASRILHSTASGVSHPLSSVFLSSLGNCLLASSLVVIHRHSMYDFSNTKPKHVGAFLYHGGYLILVKVLKGKVYEPRHWLRLANFDVQDTMVDAASLSSTFCLLSDDHSLELVVTCPREKGVWLSTIHESLTQSPIWIDEPTPSLGSKGFGDPCSKPDPLSAPLIPGQSSDQECSFADHAQNSTRPRQEYNPTPSRASSSVSIKSLFAQSTDMNIVSRSSATAKQQTDDGLRDVIWRICSNARTCGHESRTPSFSSTSSAVNLKTLTMNRLPRGKKTTVSRHNSLPNGMGSVARQELMKATSMIIRRCNREGRNAPSGFSGYEEHGSQTETDTYRTSSQLAVPADLPNHGAKTLPRDVFRNMKELFHAHPMSAVDDTTSSTQHSSLPRAQSTNIFRRLSSRKTFRRSKAKVVLP